MWWEECKWWKVKPLRRTAKDEGGVLVYVQLMNVTFVFQGPRADQTLVTFPALKRRQSQLNQGRKASCRPTFADLSFVSPLAVPAWLAAS